MIDTPRLHLRPLSMRDVDAVSALHRDPRMRRYLGDGRPLDRDRSRQWLQRHVDGWAELGYGFFAIELRDPIRFAGWFGLNLIDDHPALDGEIELGGSVDPGFWQTGIATEAATKVLDHAYTALDCSQVVARHRSDNDASARMIRKIGMLPWKSVPDLLDASRTVMVWRSLAPAP